MILEGKQLELFVWLLELIFIAIMLTVGWVRKKGLWFMFGMFIGAFSLLELSTNNLTLTNNFGGACTPLTQYSTTTMISTSSTYVYGLVNAWVNSTMTSTQVFPSGQLLSCPTVTLSSFTYFIPLILIIMNFASIVALRKQLGRGAV